MPKKICLSAMAWQLMPDALSRMMGLRPLPVASMGILPDTLLRQNLKTVQGLCAGLFIETVVQR